MQEGTLSADIVATWLRLGKGRPTLCYAVDRLHAKKLQAQFEANGVRCGYQDANTKPAERTALKRGFHNGEIEIVVSVGTLTTGIDWDVRCISLCRPTKSEILFDQIVGRGLRTADGKDYCLILDHSDNHARLGFVTDIDAAHTMLDDGRTPMTANASQIRLPKECPQCAYMKRPGVAKCPVCEYVAVAHSKIEPTAGELAELKRKAKEAKAAPFEPEVFYAQLRCHAITKGFKPGWAAMKFKDKFGDWPDRSFDHHPPAREVTPEVASWIKAMNIRWIKGKGKKFRAKPEQLPLSSGPIVPGTLCTEDDLRDFQ
jgi:superfamily II DNA or RNA helicase